MMIHREGAEEGRQRQSETWGGQSVCARNGEREREGGRERVRKGGRGKGRRKERRWGNILNERCKH